MVVQSLRNQLIEVSAKTYRKLLQAYMIEKRRKGRTGVSRIVSRAVNEFGAASEEALVKYLTSTYKL